MRYRSALLLAAAGLFGVSAAANESAMATADNQPAAAASASGAPGIFWARRVTGYLETADGTPLRYSALLPEGKGPFPVVVNYSGYDPGSIGGSAYARGETVMSPFMDRALVRAGYAVVGVNMRGSGCSGGQYPDFLAPAYGADGRDAIEFIARQPWSDGKVGMANYSFPGITQLAVAIEQPPHLKAIAPGMVVVDARLDSWAPGSIPQTGFGSRRKGYVNPMLGWFREDAAAANDSECLARLDARVDNDYPFPEQFKHPFRDDWHRARRMTDRIDRIQVPVLSMEAFQDEQTGPRGDYYQDRLRPGQVWLVQTNGHHGLYMAERFWTDQLIPFFDHFLREKPNGFDKRPQVTVWQDTKLAGPQAEAHRSRSAQPGWSFELPQYPVIVTPRAFEFGAGGALVPEGQGGIEGSDSYTYPILGPAVNTPGNLEQWGALAADWRKGSLAFTTGALAADMMVYGSASADLWVHLSSVDADVQVTLTEVLPSGEEVYLQRGWLRLSARTLDESRSTAVRPMILDEPLAAVPLAGADPVLARVEINKIAHLFRAGSRLRLWIDAPSPTGHAGFDIISIPSTVQIYRGGATRSRLVLGTIDGIEAPAARASSCAQPALSQPCRKDPLVR